MTNFMERTFASLGLILLITLLGLLIYIAGHNAADYGMVATPEWIEQYRTDQAAYHTGQ